MEMLGSPPFYVELGSRTKTDARGTETADIIHNRDSLQLFLQTGFVINTIFTGKIKGELSLPLPPIQPFFPGQ